MLSPEARHSAWVSFDGRNRQELSHGDVLRVTTSVHPVPSVARNGRMSIEACLFVNVIYRRILTDAATIDEYK